MKTTASGSNTKTLDHSSSESILALRSNTTRRYLHERAFRYLFRSFYTMKGLLRASTYAPAIKFRSAFISVPLLFILGCARNVYQIPDSVQPFAQKAINSLDGEPGTIYVMLAGKNPSYELMFSKCVNCSKQLMRLIRHSGHWVEIGGKCYHLITDADRDLSSLILKKGEKHSFSGRFHFFHGPWVKWDETTVTDSWLSPRWQPKPDSLQKKE